MRAFNANIGGQFFAAIFCPSSSATKRGHIMNNSGVQFFRYSAFTEATRQVKEVSADLQRSFAEAREQRTQEIGNALPGPVRSTSEDTGQK